MPPPGQPARAVLGRTRGVLSVSAAGLYAVVMCPEPEVGSTVWAPTGGWAGMAAGT